MIEDIAEKIAKLQRAFPKLFLLVFLIITLLLIPGILKLVENVEPSLEKVLPQEIEEVKTMNDMRTQFGADMVYLLVNAESPVFDVRDPKMLSYVDILAQKIRTHDHIFEVSTLADIVKQKNGIIPDSLIETKNILSESQSSMFYMNSDFSLSVIQIRSDTGTSAKAIKKVVEAIEYDIETSEEFNPGSSIEITGFNAIDKATFEIIMSDFSSITLISMALVALVVFITFGSFVRGMMPMVVVMVSLIWTMGIVGYLGLTITVVSMVSAAMIMGLGIDFGIHMVHSFFELRKKHDAAYSHTETLKELLRAMLGASLTTTAGFLALLFGVLPAMKTLGIILALGIMNTLIGAVFLLPVIVYLYDKNKNEV